MQIRTKPEDSGPSTHEAVAELESVNAVKRSPSGQLSVSLEEVSKTRAFRRDLQILGRIRQFVRTSASNR